MDHTSEYIHCITFAREKIILTLTDFIFTQSFDTDVGKYPMTRLNPKTNFMNKTAIAFFSLNNENKFKHYMYFTTITQRAL